MNLRTHYGDTEKSVLKVLTKLKMYAIMNMEDKGLIVQAEAGQRVKDPAAIGMGLHLLHKLLLLPKFEKRRESTN